MGPIKPAQHIDRPGPTLRSDTRGRKRPLNGGSTSLSVKRQRYTSSPQDSVNVLPPEEKKTAERKIELTQPAKRPSLEQRLRDIPAGTPENQEQAERELKKVQYSFKEISTPRETRIKCHATYHSETGKKASTLITFTKGGWKLSGVHLDKGVAFCKNDLIRQVYINTARKASFNISAPRFIIMGPIKDDETLTRIKTNPELCGYSVEGLHPSPWGTLLKRILSDFNFYANDYTKFNYRFFCSKDDIIDPESSSDSTTEDDWKTAPCIRVITYQNE